MPSAAIAAMPSAAIAAPVNVKARITAAACPASGRDHGRRGVQRRA
jgi:hypothetical protein